MASTIKVDKIAQASGTPEFTIPTADGTAKSALITDGSGVLSFATGTPSNTNFLRGDGSWQTVTTTALTGSTNTWIPTITGANALAGTANFTYDGNILDVKNSGTASSIKLYCESSNAHYQAIKAAPHAGSSDWTLTLPPTAPSSSGQVLSATTAGVASWADDVGGAMVFLAKSESSVATTSIEFQSFQNSAYEFYKIYARVRFTNYGSQVRFQFMDGATANTTSGYTSSGSEFVASSVYGQGAYAQAYMEGPANADQDSIVMMDITLTFNNSATEHQGSAISGQGSYTRHNDTAANAIFGGIFGADTDFNGLKIYSSNYTFTHHMIYVYGVKNA